MVVPEEEGSVDNLGVKSSVAEHTKEAAIAHVYLYLDTTQVADVIVGSTAVDVVDSHAGSDVFASPCDIDGVRCRDAFMGTESIPELEIHSLTMLIFPIYFVRIHYHFSFVGIDTYTEDASLAVVDIERDTSLGTGADIANTHVINEEGRTYQFRIADDFKASLSHNSQGFGSRRCRLR